MKKSLFITLILLILSIHPIGGMAHTPTRTIYVDNNNISGPWDGSIEHPYQYIQDGIEASFDGDTVIANSGIYHEEIVIDESITLDGKDRYTTIIQGSNGIVISVSANSIHVSGFTIQNGYEGINTEHSKDNTITDNIIQGNSLCGIDLGYSEGNMVINNTISDNHGAGIDLFSSSDNTITHNVISNNDYFGLLHVGSWDNIIKDNVFYSNGITISGSKLDWTSLIIQNNSANGRPILYYKNRENVNVPIDTAQVILANCTHCTIQDLNLSDVDAGIQLGFSSDNMIAGNIITNNKYHGIGLEDALGNAITGNTIKTNDYGIALSYSSSYNTITGNTINNSKGDGIYLYESSNHNTITNNTIEGNSGFGIWVSYAASTVITGNTIGTNREGIAIGYGSDNTIIDNVINGNDLSGIVLGSSSNNMIAMNTIEGNKDCGINIGWGSSENTITGNTISTNGRGVLIFRSTNANMITGNTIEINDVGVQLDLTMFTAIEDNNFMNNGRQASFSFSFPMFWSGNYWDDWVLPFPRPIYGLCWVTFDWHPAKEPYDVT